MKSDKFESVAHAVLELIHQSGISGVTHTKVARASQVSRPWIYKYVGKSSEDLISFAADYFGKKLLQLGQTGRNANSDTELTELSLSTTWILMEQFTNWKEVLPLYFRYSGSKNALGKVIAEIEEKQLSEMAKSLAKNFKTTPKEARLTAELIMAMRMGVGFRYSQLGLGKMYSMKEIQKSLRRIFEKSSHVLKLMESK